MSYITDLVETPVRVSNASQTAGGGRLLPGLPQLILGAALHCTERGGITMAALQHVLADGGYDVRKNNPRVRMTLKGLVGKWTLVHRAGPHYKLTTVIVIHLYKKINTFKKPV